MEVWEESLVSRYKKHAAGGDMTVAAFKSMLTIASPVGVSYWLKTYLPNHFDRRFEAKYHYPPPKAYYAWVKATRRRIRVYGIRSGMLPAFHRGKDRKGNDFSVVANLFVGQQPQPLRYTGLLKGMVSEQIASREIESKVRATGTIKGGTLRIVAPIRILPINQKFAGLLTYMPADERDDVGRRILGDMDQIIQQAGYTVETKTL